MQAPSKRKRDEDDVEALQDADQDDEPLDAEAIAKLVDDAPQTETLDEVTLKKMLLALEKKISTNQMMRVKHPDQPQKFVDSELDLDEELKKMHAVAASPELYPVVVKLGSLASITQLLLHENIDIAIDAINLLHELMEPDVAVDSEENALLLIDDFVAKNGLELLVQNLARLDEKQAEEKPAVTKTLNIFENLIEIRATIATVLVQKTDILKWLVTRMKAPTLDDNKVYASEMLAVMLHGNKENQQRFGSMDGMETLLTTIAPYKKRDLKSEEEEEFVENLCDALCAMLLLPENQTQFIKAEGFELMLITVKAKKFLRRSALKVIDFALNNSPEGCERFIHALGLKTLFSAFMKSGKKKDRKGFDPAEDDEHIISSIASLFRHATDAQKERLVAKFREKEHEKVDRLLELREKYEDAVSSAAAQANADEELDEEELYLKRLEGGLFKLQMIDFVIGELASTTDDILRNRLFKTLDRKDIDLDLIVKSLQEYAANIGTGQESVDEKAAKEKAKVAVLVAVLEKQRDEAAKPVPAAAADEANR